MPRASKGRPKKASCLRTPPGSPSAAITSTGPTRRRARSDGPTLNGDGSASEVEPDFLTVGGRPRWVAVDSTYAYWSDPGENEANGEGTIGRARLNGSEAPEPDFITGASQPQGVAVNGTYVLLGA